MSETIEQILGKFENLDYNFMANKNGNIVICLIKRDGQKATKGTTIKTDIPFNGDWEIAKRILTDRYSGEIKKGCEKISKGG